MGPRVKEDRTVPQSVVPCVYYYMFEGCSVANELWAIKIHLIKFQKYYK